MQINNMLDTRLFQASCLSPFGPHFVRSNMLQAYLSAGMTSSLFSIFMSICSSEPCEYSNNSVNYILEIIMRVSSGLNSLILALKKSESRNDSAAWG